MFPNLHLHAPPEQLQDAALKDLSQKILDLETERDQYRKSDSAAGIKGPVLDSNVEQLLRQGSLRMDKTWEDAISGSVAGYIPEAQAQTLQAIPSTDHSESFIALGNGRPQVMRTTSEEFVNWEFLAATSASEGTPSSDISETWVSADPWMAASLETSILQQVESSTEALNQVRPRPVHFLICGRGLGISCTEYAAWLPVP